MGVCPWWSGRHRNSGAVPFSGLAACVLFYADYANSKLPVTERPVGCCSLALHIPFLFMRDDSFQAIIGAPPPIIIAQDAREPTSNLLVAGRHYFIPSLLGIPSPWPILLRSLAPAFSLFPTLLVPSLFVCLWRLLHGRPGAASVPARVL